MADKVSAWNDKKANELSDRLKAADKRLDKIVHEIATTTDTTNIYWSKIQTDIRKEYETIRMISKEWADDSIPLGYRKSMSYELASVKSKAVDLNRDVGYKQVINSNNSKRSIAALTAETTSVFNTGYNSGQKTLIRLARMTQQVNIREAQLDKDIQEGFIDTGSVKGPTVNIRNELLKKSLDGKYVTVVDKNGVIRQYQIESYAETVARTKLQETSTQATTDAAFAVGNDLLQVSSHNTTTAICAIHEGKIYSISGNDPDFPQATEFTPFHPNCKHNMTNVFKEALEIDGTLDNYIKFSNGETSKHPTRKSHIPLDERELT